MKEIQQHATTLDDYVDIQSLLKAVEHTFPTQDSLRWFIRQHRNELVTAEALILIGKQFRFHPDVFKKVAVAIGRASIAQRVS